MTVYLASAALGVGLLLVFDALTRPASSPAARKARPGAGRRLERAASQLGWGAAASAAAGALALILTGWLALALVAAALAALAPRMAKRSLGWRRRIARREALAQVAGRLRDAVRGARGLPEAIALAAETAPASLREELAVLNETVRARGVIEGLEELERASEDPLVRRFARMLARAYRTGSRRVGTLLEVMADAAALQARTEREIRARQTSIRLGAAVMAAAPVAGLLVLRAANPRFLDAYSSFQGQAVMLLGFSLVATGYWFANRAGG